MTLPSPVPDTPDDLHVMIVAWLSKSPAQRDVALELADRNRKAARKDTA